MEVVPSLAYCFPAQRLGSWGVAKAKAYARKDAMTENRIEKPARRTEGSANEETPLESWKEIAAYLKRDVRTVSRWEKEESLPVHRHLHQSRASVYAYASELDAWREQRKPATAFTSGWLWSAPARGCTAAAVLLLALLTAASGPILTPARAADGEPPDGMTTRQYWAGPEVQLLGSVSPDGRYLSSVDMRGTGNLIIRDIAAGTDRTLTGKTGWNSSDYAFKSIFSPDGEQVAYAWFSTEQFPETGGVSYELRIINRDGSGMRRLYRNQETAYLQPHGWTPDGRWILALLQTVPPKTYQIVFISAEDGSVRVLKSLDWRHPINTSLSPDGKSIVYDFPPSEDSPQRDIYLLAADGSREVTLVKHGAHDMSPVWTPAGNEIVFTSDRSGQPGLWKLPVRGDGRAGAPSLVKPNLGLIRPMGFTLEGALYYGLEIGQNDVYRATLKPDASGYLSPPTMAVETYMGGNSVPDWSPNGEYLSYISRRGPAVRGGKSRVLVIRSLRTGEERELRAGINLTQLSVPRWSPDSRSLVTLAGRKGRWGFYGVDAETGAHKMLVDVSVPEPTPNQRTPVMLPDGKSLIHIRRVPDREAGWRLIVRNLETNSERILFRSRHLHTWALSPDGRQVAVSVSSDGPMKKFEVVEGQSISLPERGFVLLVLRVNGGETREILRIPRTEEVTGLAWTSDSRHVLYIRQTVESQLENPRSTERWPMWRVPAAGGEPLRTELSFQPDEMLSLRLHPDGRRLVYMTGRSEGAPSREIWVLENFLPKPEVAQAEQ